MCEGPNSLRCIGVMSLTLSWCFSVHSLMDVMSWEFASTRYTSRTIDLRARTCCADDDAVSYTHLTLPTICSV
eukprot:15303400-Alexandrium_andersonii.AAC.1